MADETFEEISYADNGRRARDTTNDLEDIGNSTTEIINIDTAYQPNWGPKEGFRENYQNWKDAIMKSFGIKESDFKVEYTESAGEKFYAVYHPNDTPKKLVGYIRFKFDDKNFGILEMTNFKASLQRRHLGIGGTSKAEDIEQLGQHGEGLKLSALVNRRHPYNYGFVVHSTGCRWLFGWNVDKKLNCRIERIPRARLAEQKEIAAEEDDSGVCRAAKARSWEDVSIVVGEPRRCRSLRGENSMTSKIPLSEFLEWIKLTIDIQPPKEIVRTEHGELILDPQHSNKVYLHGLQLPSGSKSGIGFIHGYNLLNVKTGRDRDTVADAGSEARKIASIWEATLFQEEKQGKDIFLKKYVDILRTRFHSSADVYDIRELMSEGIAKLVWKCLSTNKSSQFYYCSDADQNGAETIRRQLELTPISLERGLWDILRKYQLCLSPHEECLRRFKAASEIQLSDNTFPQHVLHTLKALCTLVPQFRGSKIVPVDARKLNLVVQYNYNEFRINRKHFTFEGAHDQAYCDHSSSAAHTTFTCDHVILFLWDRMLDTWQKQQYQYFGTFQEGIYKTKARAKVQQMPRGTTARTNADGNKLWIAWSSMEPHMNSNVKVRVTLHKSTCASVAPWSDTLVYKKLYRPRCRCPSAVNAAGSTGVKFTGLIRNSKYWPMVSRDEDGAFYAVVTEAVCPAECSTYIQTESEPTDRTPTFEAVSKMVAKPPAKGWISVAYDQLFQDGFPYAHTWISAQQGETQLLIAKSKAKTIKANLKRAMEDETPTQTPVAKKKCVSFVDDETSSDSA